MIHSMSGGVLSNHGKHDYAKVKMLDGDRAGDMLWFISELPELKITDKVEVQNFSYGQNIGEVVRIDKDVDEFFFPIPYKRMKKIIRIIKN